VLDATQFDPAGVATPVESGPVTADADPLALVPDRRGPELDLFDGLLVPDDDTLSLVLDGSVDARLDVELDDILRSLRASAVRHVVLELATVTFMDTTGLRFLFAVQTLADERGGSVRLADPPPAVRELLELSGASEIFTGLDPLDGEARPA
jgi:anti-anti-sigma factor